MNKSPLFSVSCIALLTGLTLQPTGFGQVNIDGLVNQAFGRLAQGRSYKTNFPVAQTRRQVVSFFIGNLNDVFTDPPVMNPVDGNSSIQVTPPQNGQPKTGLLKQALDGVAAICDNAQSTPTQLAAAEEIANQAAAAMLEGYLFAGNADLLDGLRENYPAPAGGNSWKPAEQRSAAVGMPPSYAGANILKLGYATLYFQEGIKQILDYITLGCSPNLLALDGETFPDELKHFTRYNVQPPPPPGQNDPPAPPQALPHPRFRDTVGASGLDIPSQTPGALFGESLNRLAMASQGLADRLWRAAYFKSNRPPSEKQLMLDHAQKVLKSNIQGQFLASLPMAATLEDGYSMVNGAPTQNEYQAVRIDKARAAIVASQELLGKMVGWESSK